jgi:hypothetical protein
MQSATALLEQERAKPSIWGISRAIGVIGARVVLLPLYTHGPVPLQHHNTGADISVTASPHHSNQESTDAMAANVYPAVHR